MCQGLSDISIIAGEAKQLSVSTVSGASEEQTLPKIEGLG